jgi:hypothetical protein
MYAARSRGKNRGTTREESPQGREQLKLARQELEDERRDSKDPESAMSATARMFCDEHHERSALYWICRLELT